jgi:hypothetical protein
MVSATEIRHAHPECIGRWALHEPSAKPRFLKCTHCGIEWEGTADARLAAIDENYAGIYLRKLCAEGMPMLEREDAL